MSSLVVHSVNSTPGIKQGHFDKTEFEKFIYFVVSDWSLSFEGLCVGF